MKVIKEIQWDMGHRVTNHHSLCKNLHGHRYRAEICIEGKLIADRGASDEGMVLDFGDIKKIATKHVHDVLDHGFMLWGKDAILLKFFRSQKELKHIIVPFVPTVENISAWIFTQIDYYIKAGYSHRLQLYSVTVWETPTSRAVCTRKDFSQIDSEK